MSVEQQETHEIDLLVKVSASTPESPRFQLSAKNYYYFLRLKLSKTAQPQSQVVAFKIYPEYPTIINVI